MRECPTCRRQFPDDLIFCLEDGSTLIDRGETETQFARPRTIAPSRGSSRSTYIVAALLLVVGGGFLIAAAAAGFFFYRMYGEEAAVTQTPKPAITPIATRSPEVRPSASRLPINVPNRPEANDSLSVDPSLERNRKPVPKQISGGVLNGKATSLPKPAYPPAARAVRASGTVSVQVLVNEQGYVVSASAVSGHALLRSSAEQAARVARFAPTLFRVNR